MENKQLVLCDTNIFIEFYKKNSTIISKLKNIGSDKIALSVITGGELLYGALNRKELNIIKKDSENLILLRINDAICNKFIELMEKYSLSHKLAVPDALIAATALIYDIELFTLNQKDFRFIDGIK